MFPKDQSKIMWSCGENAKMCMHTQSRVTVCVLCLSYVFYVCLKFCEHITNTRVLNYDMDTIL